MGIPTEQVIHMVTAMTTTVVLTIQLFLNVSLMIPLVATMPMLGLKHPVRLMVACTNLVRSTNVSLVTLSNVLIHVLNMFQNQTENLTDPIVVSVTNPSHDLTSRDQKSSNLFNNLTLTIHGFLQMLKG